MPRLRSHAGQTAAEYLGGLLLVAVIVAAIVGSGVPGKLSCAAHHAIGQLTGNDAEICGGTVVGPNDPTTDPAADSDGDGISDADEGNRRTDPNNSDTDGDGVADGEELDLGLAPTTADSDGDGLSDGRELELDTDPLVADTDGDGKPDGSDKDPFAYNGDLGDVVKGFGCNEWTLGPCPDADDSVRTSKEYVLGQLLVGFLSINDARELASAILKGQPGAAAMAALGFIPGAGDAIAMGNKIKKLIKRFPERRGELIGILDDLLPGPIKRKALDIATDGGYSAMRRNGTSEETVERLLRRGTDVKRLASQARLTDRSYDAVRNAELKTRVTDPVWAGRKPQEAWGVESALMELEKTPGMRILYDGRPGKGKPPNGPDIVAFNENTGRIVIVEAKGGSRAFGERTLRSTAGNGASRRPSRSG